MRILVVDDSRVMRQIVIRTLRQAGVSTDDVVEAENGAAALDVIARVPIDLVLSDWNMPEMSGIDLLERVRASGSAVPFGFITSEGSDAMRERARSTGALFLVVKPFTADDLAEALAGAGVG